METFDDFKKNQISIYEEFLKDIAQVEGVDYE